MRGSAEYTPSTPEWVPLSSASASISAARSAAAVSVVKKGLPVPAAKITTRPCSRWRIALRRMYGSHSLGISMALCTRVSWPARSRASCSARAFMTVPSMPMWSDWVASMPDIAPVRPRQKLPPPTTTHTSTSMSRTAMISFAVVSRVAASRPCPNSPASASPDGLKTIRFHRGNSSEDTGRSADLDLGEANDRRRADHLRDRLLVVFGVRLVEQGNILVETVEAALDDLRQCRFRLALVAADRLQRLTLVGDDLRRDIVAAEVLRPGKGDVHGDVVGQ